MNIDDLRNQWNNQDGFQNLSTKNLNQETKHPIETLKRKLKQEYILQLGAILFAAFIPQMAKFGYIYTNVYYIFYAILVLISAYYFKGFYDFYKTLNPFNDQTQQSIWRLYFELKIQIERYKSFGFLLIPLAWLVFLLLFLESSPEVLSSSKIYSYIGLSILTSLAAIFLIVAWAELVYGKIAKNLHQIIKQFED